MSKLTFAAPLLYLLLLPAVCIGQNNDKNEDVVGARWEYEIFDGKELITKGFFRVHKKAIYHGPSNEKVGHITVISPTETKLVINDLKTRVDTIKLTGTAYLKKVDKKPPEGIGRFELKDGTKYKMTVIMKDR